MFIIMCLNVSVSSVFWTYTETDKSQEGNCAGNLVWQTSTVVFLYTCQWRIHGGGDRGDRPLPLQFIIFIFSPFIKRAKLNTGSTVK